MGELGRIALCHIESNARDVLTTCRRMHAEEDGVAILLETVRDAHTGTSELASADLACKALKGAAA